MSIHPTAIVSPSAQIGPDVQIGPFCIVEPDAAIGSGCVLESHVVVKQRTTLGADNHLFDGVILGGLPQHVHVPDQPGQVVIGSGNTIRENVTVHRALVSDHTTVVGDHCLLMVGVHVAHDCHLGNHVIMANNSMLAGHVHVDDRAYISGAAGVHQFCRVGTFAMVGGQAHLVQDVPPYVTVERAEQPGGGAEQDRAPPGRLRPGDDPRTDGRVSVDLPQRPALGGASRAASHPLPRRPRRAVLRVSVDDRPRHRFRAPRPPGATIKLRDTVEADSEPEVRMKFG